MPSLQAAKPLLAHLRTVTPHDLVINLSGTKAIVMIRLVGLDFPLQRGQAIEQQRLARCIGIDEQIGNRGKLTFSAQRRRRELTGNRKSQ